MHFSHTYSNHESENANEWQPTELTRQAESGQETENEEKKKKTIEYWIDEMRNEK